MSSSEGPRRFAIGLATGLALIIVAGLSATWAVDPTGVLSRWGGGALCRSGAKVAPTLAQSALLIDVYRPREVILGSSRSIWMFAAAEAPGRASLGISSATIDQIDQLARRAIDTGGTERLWIGLDVGAFMHDRPNPQPAPAAPGRSPGEAALLSGFAKPAVWTDSFSALLSGACGEPTTTPLGFVRGPPPGSSPDRADLGDETAQRRTIAARDPDQAMLLARSRLRQLAALLQHARARRVTVILFLTPSHPRYDALLREAGLSGFHAAWRASTRRLAARFGAVMVAADDPLFLAAATRGRCPPGRSLPDCAFFDVSHARPAIGNAIIARGNAGADGNPPPGNAS